MGRAEPSSKVVYWRPHSKWTLARFASAGRAADPGFFWRGLALAANHPPAAAEVLVSSSNPIYLGLAFVEDPAVARALAKSRKGVGMPRFRAATPDVIAIFRQTSSITTPPLDSLYVLTDSPVR